VAGVVAPQIRFEVWLPPPNGAGAWNGKLNGVGNGGLAGTISYGAMMQSLARGYATASTDTGHSNQPGNEGWPLGHPEPLVDFAPRSIHMTALAARGIVEAYYGRGLARSYFTGCSLWRRPGALRSAEIPGRLRWHRRRRARELPHPHVAWRAVSGLGVAPDAGPPHPGREVPLIERAAFAACDAIDGVQDGVLDDPRRCRFDPSTLLCKGADGADCLTAAHVDSVQRIYEGPKDPSSGKAFWPGYERTSEPLWPSHIFEPFSIPLSYFKYMALQDPGWDWRSFLARHEHRGAQQRQLL
jgi:feruloyl esterase